MGRVFKFHNDVDTDQIIASQYLLLPNIEEMKVYTFESIDKDFAKKVKEGDIVDSNTVIGLVGGESTAYINGGYDKGTNGPHLHFVVVEDFHTTDFNIYTINPRYIYDYPPLLNGYFSR